MNGWKLILSTERPDAYPELEPFEQHKDPLKLVNLAEEHPEKAAPEPPSLSLNPALAFALYAKRPTLDPE